jgi:hypothetical protein
VLSSMDDYPIHQIAAPIRHVDSSDRNFYDRYYFNLHGSSDELFMVIGMGQYPNLATQDAFACVCSNGKQRVLRASKELGDRMDTTVGPFRVEVIEPLHRVRVLAESTEHPLAFDLTWTGAIPAFEEPQHFIRSHGRVMFDSHRFAQTGFWEGTLEVEGETIAITPDRWKGTRDRSWGIRPVGETEPPGVREGTPAIAGMWNYAPMQFDDYSLLYIVQEDPNGDRPVEEAVRIWNDPARGHEWLGRPEFEHTLEPGTRMIRQPSRLSFPDAPGGGFDITVTPLRHAYIAVGTGYGMDDDWRHGMYQGPLVVQYREWKQDELEAWGWYGVVDHVARFETSTGDVGFGLHEHGFFGPFPKYGLERSDDGAPA